MPKKNDSDLDPLRPLRLFTRAIDLGSFSAVAREEHISQPTVSKIIALLERRLGVRLLERTTTNLAPTEEGKRFYVRTKQLIEEYVEVVADVRGQTQQLAGAMLVNAPMGLGELRLNTLILEFLERYPRIEIELILDDRVIDLVEEGVDVAIRLGGNLAPNVIARQIASSARVLVATPDYLERAPRVLAPEDLTRHQYVRFARLSSGSTLEFSRKGRKVTVPTNGRYRVNSSLALRQCFLEGMGFGSAPAWLVQDLIDSKHLIRVLPKWQLPSQAVHLVYPSRKYLPLRTRAFLQFMSERIPGLPGFQTADS
jgi:DNA-binding transcriptional LysR family regulator